MSDDFPRKHHSGTSSLPIFAGLLLLYVASWPPIEIKVTSRAYTTFTMPPGPIVTTRTGGTAVKHYMVPQWVNVVYYPLHWLRYSYEQRNPLDMYHMFWAKIL